MIAIREKYLWAFAFLLIALAYFFGLFIDLTGDSGLYAAISRQMVESGDWFNLKINGVPYDQKPHLFFWLAGAGVQLFGNTNFAFKLFPFLYGAAGIYFTYRLGRQIFTEETGKMAALITGTSQIYFLYFFDFHTDSVLQTGVVLALWQLAAYLQTHKPVNFVMGFLGIGLAMLSKGPIGGVLPFFAVLLYLLVRKDFRRLFHPKWLSGIFISLLIISPSLVHLYRSFGSEGIRFYFITNNFGRITGDYAGSSTDYFFYFHTLLWAFLPWTIFVVAAIVAEIRGWFRKSTGSEWGFFLLGSVLVLLLVLSIAKGKAPNYFLIAIPPVAVVAAKWILKFDSFSAKFQQRLMVSQIIFIGFLTAFLVFTLIQLAGHKIMLPAAIVIFSVLIVFVLRKNRMAGFYKIILTSVLVAGVLNLIINVAVLPDLFAYQGPRQVLKIYNENKSPQSKLYNLNIEEYALFFYAGERVENITNWVELKAAFALPDAWIYANEIDYREMLFQKFDIDTVYHVKQRGMNKVSLKFLNPKTRGQTLKTNYLIVTGMKKSE